ncbi:MULTISPECIES: aminoglycoside phosphotransferase family protein [unclassified Leptolyngbya]|uniref:phosphotransferase enzyme family protein n=1 Tax=unclassified Leptolyngbya TaxID=2650499 RepID=UPI001687DB97|nr:MULTISPECIES: aminoglycoside phosphotransferase family protein [unclassified Leptolyngbya]MBD1910876.1 aminoglycoside phosphotransferase family protein [Leptolyngbya sp. FACHB-8]MBD2153729.1 aminoglycoside phosphotransferase family protein [Leptolyngbya sp. FACHB-16]
MSQNARLQRALDAASAIARNQGLQFERAITLQNQSNIIAHLSPTPVVARVMGSTSTIRQGDAWFTREVAIAQHLMTHEAPIIPPTTLLKPGPHYHDGFILSFWKFVQVLPEPFDPTQAGQALRQCHTALKHFPGELPYLALIREGHEILTRLIAESTFAEADAALLVEVSQSLEPRLQNLSMQPLHGDPHSGNVLNTSDGVLWTDWEDAFIGPIEWDLASLVAAPHVFGVDQDKAEAALQGYGSFDPEALDLCIEARTLVALVWSIILYREHPNPERLPRIERRLQWLRDRYQGSDRPS